MQDLKPGFSVTVDENMGEVYFSARGFWDMATMIEFQKALLSKSKPLIERGAKIRALGDLTDFVTQEREIAAAMRVVIEESKKLGTERTAIVSNSPLATLQYRRLNDGINVQIFETRADALSWLRARD